jgi:hypothetical protein
LASTPWRPPPRRRSAWRWRRACPRKSRRDGTMEQSAAGCMQRSAGHDSAHAVYAEPMRVTAHTQRAQPSVRKCIHFHPRATKHSKQMQAHTLRRAATQCAASTPRIPRRGWRRTAHVQQERVPYVLHTRR